jgi:Radical SAM superfamily
VSIVDNVLPRKISRELFKKVGRLKKDLHMFAEIRAHTPASELEVMKWAGMQELQIGIEALSTSLLKKLHKGTNAIQNLEIMRNCEALGIINCSNLILQFPGSDEQDVAETLRNLEFALSLRPLHTVDFWLGLGSPVWQNPAAYGIRAVFNHPHWSRLFPHGISGSMVFMIQAFRGDRAFQKKIWQPVKKMVAAWQKAYAGLQGGTAAPPVLSFRDGREFLIIKQRVYQADSIAHRLVGTSRQIYLFCMQHRSLKRIRSRFPAFAEDKIVAFLKMMVDKKLMFEEGDEYLSLAVPAKPGK